MTRSQDDLTLNGPDEGLWEAMRAEERAEKLAHVAEDSARDARIAELLSSSDTRRLS